jgi:hypothetical protein
LPKVTATAWSESVMKVDWVYGANEPVPLSVDITESDPNGVQIDSKNGVFALGSPQFFGSLQPNTTYRYKWCGVHPGNPTDNIVCEAPVSGTTLQHGSGGGGGDLPAPWITGNQTLPATVGHKNGIKISWGSSVVYGFFQARWAEKGTPASQWAQVTIDSSGNSGWFVFEGTQPGVTYDFIVQGCDSGLLGSSHCSLWSGVTEVTAGQNFTSLRQFLQASGINPTSSLRSHLALGTSLKSWMAL